VRTVDFSPTGHLVASGSTDRTIRLWVPKVKVRPLACFSIGYLSHGLHFAPLCPILALTHAHTSTGTFACNVLAREITDLHITRCKKQHTMRICSYSPAALPFECECGWVSCWVQGESTFFKAHSGTVRSVNFSNVSHTSLTVDCTACGPKMYDLSPSTHFRST
jgi:hypothetical protein